MTSLTIAEVAKKQGFTPQYVRYLIRKGKLKSERVPLAPDSNVTHHLIEEEDLNEFLDASKRKSKRQDKRNKYVLYATPEEAAVIKTALVNVGLTGIAESFRTANPIKPRYNANPSKAE